MTGGSVIILGQVGDNFGAGMTGGMAFIYDPKNNFENFVNSASIIWQPIETEYWKNFLKNNLVDFLKETNSNTAKIILKNYAKELLNFKQVCPIEMLDKLDNPITLTSTIKKVS
jgi:glutamate synthase (NADPH/NADH) large chain